VCDELEAVGRKAGVLVEVAGCDAAAAAGLNAAVEVQLGAVEVQVCGGGADA
jgi:hypothetical protein